MPRPTQSVAVKKAEALVKKLSAQVKKAEAKVKKLRSKKSKKKMTRVVKKKTLKARKKTTRRRTRTKSQAQTSGFMGWEKESEQIPHNVAATTPQHVLSTEYPADHDDLVSD